jgi:hypothetical protein
MAAAEPFNTAKLAAVLSDGRIIDVTIKNFGWDEATGSYVIEWSFEGIKSVSRFATIKHEPQFCSEPDVRLCRDYEHLEATIEKHCGCELDDLEES